MVPFLHPGGLRPRLYWVAARGTGRPAENRAHRSCRWPPPRQGRWARSASYLFGAPRRGCPWRVSPASVLGCVRCGGWRVWTRSLTRPVSRTVRRSTRYSAGAPGLFRVDANTSPCRSEDATPGSPACVRVLVRLGRVRRAGLPGAFWCVSPFPLAALSFCFAWPPLGRRCPFLGPLFALTPCLVLFFSSPLLFSARPLCLLLSLVSGPGCPGPWQCVLFVSLALRALSPRLCVPPGRWLLCGGCCPPPFPPLLRLAVFVAAARCLGFVLFFCFFLSSAPPLSLAFSGFRPRVPWALALCLVLFFFPSRLPALRALSRVLCLRLSRWLLPGGCCPPPSPPPFFFFLCAPPLSLAFSGFQPRVPRALALCFVCFVALPLPGSPCALASFVCHTRPLAAPWWLLPPPPPPFVSRGFRRCRSVLPSFFFLRCAPPLSLAFSGFRPWVPWASALCVVCLVGLRLLGSPCALASFVLPAWTLAAPWCLLPPPPLLRLAVFVAAARCCVPCAVLCCVSLSAVLRRAAARCAARCCAFVCCVVLLRSLGAAACCAVPCPSPWGPVLCGAVFRGVPPRCVLCAVCVLSWRGGARCCSLLCFVLRVSCGAVLCVPCPLRPVRCCASLCWCAFVVLFLWYVLLLAPGAVVRCCVLCCFLWCALVRCWVWWPVVVCWWRVSVSVSLSGRVVCFTVVGVVCCRALLPCVVLCAAVLSRGAVLLCSAVVLRCCWCLLCPLVACRAVLCCAVGWLCCFLPGGRDADSQQIQFEFAEFAANLFAARTRCEFGLKFLVLRIQGKFALRIRGRRQNDHACAVFSPDEKLTLNCAMQ